MIYLVNASSLTRDGLRQHYHESPRAVVIRIQRPFSTLSIGSPIIVNHPESKALASLEEYRKWLFKNLLTNNDVITEFTRILDILIEEGDVVLQCSCKPGTPCHGIVVKSALRWASQFGIDGWQAQLKETYSRISDNVSK